jgi:hypothetical protein
MRLLEFLALRTTQPVGKVDYFPYLISNYLFLFSIFWGPHIRCLSASHVGMISRNARDGKMEGDPGLGYQLKFFNGKHWIRRSFSCHGTDMFRRHIVNAMRFHEYIEVLLQRMLKGFPIRSRDLSWDFLTRVVS